MGVPREDKKIHVNYDVIFNKDYGNTDSKVAYRTVTKEKRPNLIKDDFVETLQVELPTET